MNIVLLEPEIPMNTGNIGRTCAATETRLHLIRPLGFSVDDKYIKRSGMDYWQHLDISYYDGFSEFLEANTGITLYMATTKAEKTYAEAVFAPDDYIMFGKESAGIPEDILVNYRKATIRIPMLEQCRSLNLSNSVAVILYEALRQNNFTQLSQSGQLHTRQWREE